MKVRTGSWVVAAALLLVAVAALSGAARGAPAQPPPPEQLAAAACAQVQAQMGGSQFASKFGSMAGCVSQAVPIAEAAIEKCKTDANPQACIQQELQQGVQALAGGSGGGMPTVGALADDIASQACERAKEKLGAKFEKQIGSMAACKAKIDAQATRLAKDAIAKCQSASDQEACTRREVEKDAATLETVLRSGAGGANAVEIADEIADRACEAAKGKLGSKFEKQLGSLDACKAKIKADATKLAKDAIAKCKDAKDEEGCIRQAVETDAVSLQAGLGAGAGPSAGEIGDEIAGEACQAAKGKLGAKFEKKLGSLDACKGKIKADATKLAKDAIAKCRDAKDLEGCIRQAVETDAVSLQFALGSGAGPSADEVGDEIAGEACQAAKDERGAEFQKKLGSLDNCKQRIQADAQKRANDAIAKCRDAKDKGGCIRQAVESGAASLHDDLEAVMKARELATLRVRVINIGRVEGPGISCSNDGGDCTETYDRGTRVDLRAVWIRGSAGFQRWIGRCFGMQTAEGCWFVLNSDRTMEAHFRVPDR